jgi:predicted nucleotidyltransferase
MSDIDKIRGVLAKYNPVQAFLYGSRATGVCKPTSDYDIMVFFKGPMFPLKETEEERFQRFYKMSCELKIALEKPVDLVVMKTQKKWVNHTEERDILFFEQVRVEAISVFNNKNGTELLEMSSKIGLYKS